jgi:hypothetical protein
MTVRGFSMTVRGFSMTVMGFSMTMKGSMALRVWQTFLIP